MAEWKGLDPFDGYVTHEYICVYREQDQQATQATA